jgi:hypothetical protein
MQGREDLKRLIALHPEMVPWPELDRLLLAYGFEGKIRGWHCVYVLGPWQITVPITRPYVHMYFVRQVLRILDQVDQQRAQKYTENSAA